MDASALIAVLQDAVPGAQFEAAPSIDLQTTMYVTADALPAVAQALRDRGDLGFTLLAELTAVDLWPTEPRFELVYIVVSPANRLRLRLKVRLNAEGAHVATVTGIWPGANWLEREVWDMFGIVFDGHNDLRRLLMPEDWEGHPQRKDYPVQIQKAAQTYAPLEVSQEQFQANLERDRVKRTH